MDFEALYRQHRDSVFQLTLRLLGDREMAVEVTQEAFTKAYEAKESFRGDAKPSTWLFRIAYNAAIARLRERASGPAGLDGFDRPDNPSTRPDRIAERDDLRSRVRLALDGLDEEDRRLLALQMEEGIGYEDLSRILGCSVEAVRMRVSRARRRLKEILMPVLGIKR